MSCPKPGKSPLIPVPGYEKEYITLNPAFGAALESNSQTGVIPGKVLVNT